MILEHASHCRSTTTISNSHPFLQVLIIVILVTAIWSALYLNKCMMCFGNTQVVPFYYCTFTTLSILGGGVVY